MQKNVYIFLIFLLFVSMSYKRNSSAALVIVFNQNMTLLWFPIFLFFLYIWKRNSSDGFLHFSNIYQFFYFNIFALFLCRCERKSFVGLQLFYSFAFSDLNITIFYLMQLFLFFFILVQLGKHVHAY